MFHIIINVCKSSILIIRMIAMVMLQFTIAFVRLNPKIAMADLKIIGALSITLVFLFVDFFISSGVLIGVILRRDEERFNILYTKFTTYFENLYTKLDDNVKQSYTLNKILTLNINI